VEKVRKYRDSNTFAAEIVDEIANITLEGMERMKQDDRVGLGSLMTKNHKLLSILGVSCPQLNKLVECSLPYSYGAKLTGSGGGGCMIALTDHPDKVARAITLHGGTPYIVNTGVPGVQVDVKKSK
jgi:mevalonate kinase